MRTAAKMVAALIADGLYPHEIAGILKVTEPAVYAWKKGLPPRPDLLERLTDFHRSRFALPTQRKDTP
jgi:hypothetical protein